MKARRSDSEVPIEVPPLAGYLTAIRARNPGLPPSADEIVTRLAHLYRMLEYHGKRLETDPGDAYSTEHYQKLATLALRHEDALAGYRRGPGAIAPIKREFESGKET